MNKLDEILRDIEEKGLIEKNGDIKFDFEIYTECLKTKAILDASKAFIHFVKNLEIITNEITNKNISMSKEFK